MTLYERYRSSGLDLTSLELGPGSESSDYLCTPEGAQVIGWAGVDGIHYCFVEGFGEMVFAVDPSDLPGRAVHPVARSFQDFLRLLLACEGLAAVQQAHRWSREDFESFLWESGPPEPERQAALDRLREELSLAPMEDPYGYMEQVRSGFDDSRIPYRADFRPYLPEEPRTPERPEWKVCFTGGFGPHTGRDRPGKEMEIGKSFCWGKDVWHVPAVYACGAGLVVDLCKEIEPARIRAFMDAWGLWEADRGPLSQEERERMWSEDPWICELEPKAVADGRELRRKHGFGLGWTPVSCRPGWESGRPGRQDWEAGWLMEHYGLDPGRGWSFHRESFPWAASSRPALKTLVLSLERRPIAMPGPRFTVSGPGERVPFVHPVTGRAHILYVEGYEEQELAPGRLCLQGEGWERPTRFTAMTYRVCPELPGGALSLQDCGEGDRPYPKVPLDPMLPTASNAVAIGIIGGSDGPTATLLSAGVGHACSALRFRHAQQIQWRMVFYERALDGVEVELI